MSLKTEIFFCALAFIYFPCTTNFVDLPLLEEGRECNFMVDYISNAFLQKKYMCAYII